MMLWTAPLCGTGSAGRSGDRENPFGSTHFQVHANDWDPIRAEH